jgi:DnaJ-class molecular chaperone
MGEQLWCGSYLGILFSLSHLLRAQEVDLVEALCGFQRPVTHLDGRQMLVTSIPGEVVAPNSVRIVREQGLPQYPNSALDGDLIVVFKVSVKTVLTTREKLLGV